MSQQTSLGLPAGSGGKESTCNAGGLGSIPGSGRSPGGGKGCPLQRSGRESSMDCVVHGVAKSPTLLSGFHLTPFCQRPVRGINTYKTQTVMRGKNSDDSG